MCVCARLCVYGHYVELTCVCLLLNRAIESTYRENLSAFYSPSVSVLMVTGFHPPPISLPPAQHVCPRGALLPASNCHSPGALRSAGGKSPKHHFHTTRKLSFYNWVHRFMYFWSSCTEAKLFYSKTHSKHCLKLALLSGTLFRVFICCWI